MLARLLPSIERREHTSDARTDRVRTTRCRDNAALSYSNESAAGESLYRGGKEVSPRASTTIRVVLTVLLVILGVLGCIPAMFTPMMFDDGAALRNPPAIILALSVVTWPLSCLIAMILSWALRKHGRASLRAFLLPLVNLVAGSAALLWIMVVQDGQFTS